jgi:prepilin-type N-terminal cleavage/methylation domain-containing protein
MRQSTGFTTLELIIALLIIAILVAVAWMSLNEQAEQKANTQSMGTTPGAVQLTRAA